MAGYLQRPARPVRQRGEDVHLVRSHCRGRDDFLTRLGPGDVVDSPAFAVAARVHDRVAVLHRTGRVLGQQPERELGQLAPGVADRRHRGVLPGNLEALQADRVPGRPRRRRGDRRVGRAHDADGQHRRQPDRQLRHLARHVPASSPCLPSNPLPTIRRRSRQAGCLRGQKAAGGSQAKHGMSADPMVRDFLGRAPPAPPQDFAAIWSMRRASSAGAVIIGQ